MGVLYSENDSFMHRKDLTSAKMNETKAFLRLFKAIAVSCPVVHYRTKWVGQSHYLNSKSFHMLVPNVV